MFRDRIARRSVKQVLAGNDGSSIAEGLGGVALVLIILTVLGVGITTNMGAVTTIATKAERQALVTALVGDKQATVQWGTEAAPFTQEVDLPNGRVVKVTTWRDEDETSTRLNAVTPISGDADEADCTSAADTAKQGCLYASRLHANDLGGVSPTAIVRKTAGDDDVAGSVHDRVGTDTAIPQGTVFATGADDTATGWRYLIAAHATSGEGQITITQGGKTLARIPVTTTTGSYYGTFTAKAGVPAKATVTAGNVVVSTVFIYRAGS